MNSTVKELDLFQDLSDDMIKFDAELHQKQIDKMSEAVDRGELVPELVVLGNLISGKKIDTKRFVESRLDAGKKTRCEIRGLSKPRRN